TIAAWLEMLEKTSISRGRNAPHIGAATENRQSAYLIDRWPDHELPLLERELEEMKRRNVPVVPFVCELNSSARLNSTMQQIARSLEFLPEATVLEAERRANPNLAQQLEEERAQDSSRVPGAVFLREARFALVLRKLLQSKTYRTFTLRVPMRSFVRLC